ncbi:MAG TPA: hypothetical protein VLF91_00960 [Candidatus Saccharimonadales bacterium]|nr:hypothetical protein [Candidatus Saccharimonadales bacterium]
MSELGRLVAARAEKLCSEPEAQRLGAVASIGADVALKASAELQRYSKGAVQVPPEAVAAAVTHEVWPGAAELESLADA